MKTYGPGLGEGHVYIGIDQSLTGFGLTFLTLDGGFETFVYKGQGKGIDRLLDIEEWFRGKLRRYQADPGPVSRYENAAIESPVQKSPNALNSGQLYAIVLRTLYLEGGEPGVRRPLRVAPGTLKKYVTGKGVADKNLMLLHTFKRFGVEFDDDNAADSYGLARIAAGIALNKTDEAVLKSLTDPKYRE